MAGGALGLGRTAGRIEGNRHRMRRGQVAGRRLRETAIERDGFVLTTQRSERGHMLGRQLGIDLSAGA